MISLYSQSYGISLGLLIATAISQLRGGMLISAEFNEKHNSFYIINSLWVLPIAIGLTTIDHCQNEVPMRPICNAT